MLNNIQRTIDNTSLLAFVTAIVLLGLYFVTNHMLVLVTALPYLIIGSTSLYFFHRKTTESVPEAENNMVEKAVVNLDTTLTIEDLQAMTTHMGATVDGLVRATQAINDVTHQQSSSAEEQATMIGSTNDLLENFLKLSETISDQARTISQAAQQAAEMSESGQGAISQSINAMDDIRGQVQAIGATIVTLAQLTRQIDAIISSVSEIATQSNLLALNASIEAARAGVHGRGFAVVADEVRTLAQQSTESAGQVRHILGEIQSAMKETVRATQMGIENVDKGVARTREANDVMVQLSDTMRDSREAVSNIYQIIRQQADGMEEIAISIDRIDQITQQTLASTRTVEAVSSNLTRLANDLQQAVNISPN